MDIVDKATRSRMMAGIRGKDTKPEMLVRRFLHAQGFRYRLHDRRYPGRPDLLLPKYHVAIFVHGCFWHQHKGCPYATSPSDNAEKWAAKFKDNKARDVRNVETLVSIGWRVIVIWECGLRKRFEKSTLDWLVNEIVNPSQELLEWPHVKS